MFGGGIRSWLSILFDRSKRFKRIRCKTVFVINVFFVENEVLGQVVAIVISR